MPWSDLLTQMLMFSYNSLTELRTTTKKCYEILYICNLVVACWYATKKQQLHCKKTENMHAKFCLLCSQARHTTNRVKRRGWLKRKWKSKLTGALSESNTVHAYTRRGMLFKCIFNRDCLRKTFYFTYGFCLTIGHGPGPPFTEHIPHLSFIIHPHAWKWDNGEIKLASLLLPVWLFF